MGCKCMLPKQKNHMMRCFMLQINESSLGCIDRNYTSKKFSEMC